MKETKDKTCLSYWFPKLKAAGLPVPETRLVLMPNEAMEDVYRVFDGKEMTGASRPFLDALTAAANEIGYPCFLRTGQTSGKHEWERTCFVLNAESLPQHVINIIEFSECVSLVGLPWNVWAVRELLPTKPLGVCPRYGNMPLCREVRFFVVDGEVQCWHPYWPLEALEQGGADVSLYESLAASPDYDTAFNLAHKTARAIEGAWSVDVLETERGWYVTDMAEADRSFHWEGCERTSGVAA